MRIRKSLVGYLLVLLLALVAVSPRLSAQQVKVSGGGAVSDTLATEMIGSARVQIYYDLSYCRDSTQPELRTHAQTVLLLGHKQSSYMDYHALLKDSVYNASSKSGASMTELLSLIMPLGKKVAFDEHLITNYPTEGVYTVQYNQVAKQLYRYQAPMPVLEWQLGSEQKELLGFTCFVAMCHYAGRNYIAWYAPDIPVREGPYLFGGLPGLIMEFYDTRDHYHFTLSGLQTEGVATPIYLLSDHVVELPRHEVRQLVQNIKTNAVPLSMLLSGSASVDTSKLPKTKRKPYNPLELQ